MADPPDPLLSSNWSRFVPGQTLSGRFRIDSLLGEGGMGEVYRATDLALDNNQVALKTLRSDYASIPEMAQAFRGEVLKAQAVTHRNVCRIHQLEEDTADADDPLLYFTMELIPGQTLAKLLRQGPVAEPLASSILLQVAEGLAAAHSATPRAVIHCDLKPGNVMVELRGEADCRAVITDFGLARMEQTTAEDGTRFSTVLFGAGTRLYLAPEQVLGKAASEASDIYAFGLIAYEVLTGQLPHADLSVDGQVTSRALKAPPPPSTLRPGLPPHWDVLVTRCLEPDPNRRWRSMAEVVEAIANPVRPWWALPRLTRRQWHIVAGSTISLAGASLLAAAYRYWNQGRANAAPGTLIVMTPVEGLQDPPIEPVLRTALEPSPRLRLWDVTRLPTVLSQMGRPANGAVEARSWREVARRENAQFLVFTNLASLADGFTVTVSVEQPGNSLTQPDKRWREAFTASNRAELLQAANRAGLWVRDQLGESAGSITSTNPATQDVATSSWEAWKEFQRGETLSRSRHTQDEEEAAVAYDAALRHDPNFALAMFRKGDLLVHVGKNQEGFAAYAMGARMSQTHRLSPWWDLLYRFELASDTGDWALAEKLARERMQKFPDHSRVHFYAAWPLLHMGHTEEALARFDRARQIQPGANVHSRLALAHYALGHRQQAAEQLEIVRQLGNVKWATSFAVMGEYMLHQHRRAMELLPAALAADRSARAQSELAIKECIILADSGQTAQALEKAITSATMDTTAELRDRRAIKLMAAAWLCWELGALPDATKWAAQSLALDAGMPNRLHGGALLARCGRLAEATRLLQEWPALELHNYHLGRLRLSAEIELARGNESGAIRLVGEARQLDASAYGNLHDTWVLTHADSPEDALAEVERLLNHKSLQLQLSWPEPAGHWRRALLAGLEVSKKLGNPRADWQTLLGSSTLN